MWIAHYVSTHMPTRATDGHVTTPFAIGVIPSWSTRGRSVSFLTVASNDLYLGCLLLAKSTSKVMSVSRLRSRAGGTPRPAQSGDPRCHNRVGVVTNRSGGHADGRGLHGHIDVSRSSQTLNHSDCMQRMICLCECACASLCTSCKFEVVD
jgi:hypothetical protein